MPTDTELSTSPEDAATAPDAPAPGGEMPPTAVGAAELSARSSRGRVLAFVAICALSLLLGGAAIFRSMQGTDAPPPAAAPAAPGESSPIPTGTRLLFVEAANNPPTTGGRIMSLGADGAVQPAGSDQQCLRLYAAAGEGLCLILAQGFDTRSAVMLDGQLHAGTTLPATGLPSRTRISPDGRFGSMTFFLWQSHGYADGNYSTQTQIVEMATGKVVADLEQFTVYKNGERFQSQDFNFWGVTFAKDSNRFYATLASGGTTYLVEGNVATREARVLRENVECPSLSPDNTRIVFKKRIESNPLAVWRLYVLDLATMQETPLNETRNVDDQVEWLDDNHVLYTPPTPRPEIWVATVDGSAPPRMLVSNAVSPAVMH